MRWLLFFALVVHSPLHAASFTDWVRNLNTGGNTFRGNFTEKPMMLNGFPRAIFDGLQANNNHTLEQFIVETEGDADAHAKTVAMFFLWNLRSYRGTAAKNFPAPFTAKQESLRRLILTHFVRTARPAYVLEIIDLLQHERNPGASNLNVASLVGTQFLFELLAALSPEVRRPLLQNCGEGLRFLVQELEHDFLLKHREVQSRAQRRGSGPHAARDRVTARWQIANDLFRTAENWGLAPYHHVASNPDGTLAPVAGPVEAGLIEELAGGKGDAAEIVDRILRLDSLTLPTLLRAKAILVARGSDPGTITEIDHAIADALPEALRLWLVTASAGAVEACAKVIVGETIDPLPE